MYRLALIFTKLFLFFHLVSAYELHSSGLIQALLKMFAIESKNRKSTKLQRQREDIFRKVFCTKDGENIATALVKKLIAVLETIENCPYACTITPSIQAILDKK